MNGRFGPLTAASAFAGILATLALAPASAQHYAPAAFYAVPKAALQADATPDNSGATTDSAIDADSPTPSPTPQSDSTPDNSSGTTNAMSTLHP